MDRTSRPQAVIAGRLLDGRAVTLTVRDARIAGIEPLTEALSADAANAPALPWLAPGLVDLQLNGYGGIDFNTLPLGEEQVAEVTSALWSHGVTSYLPTVITNSDEAIAELLGVLAAAADRDPLTGASIAGIHLEGPFLSPEDGARGAHSAAYVKAPDWELFQRWQEAAHGRIRLLTLSPEWPQAPDFIARCAASGVLVSIGHTAATPQQIREAVAAGARMSTHLGNGSHLMLPRHDNYLWEQLAADELTAGVIADGFHLPESLLKVFLRAKPGRIALVSDAVYLSGLAPGRYTTHIGGEVVLTPAGKLHLAANDKLLAGSAQMLPAGIGHLVRRGLATLEEAWTLASSVPAGLLDRPDLGRIELGAAADLVLLRTDAGAPVVEAVYKQGQKVIGSSGSA
ncbi:amidohydrolase family protein [Paenibacillus sp. IB182496]|uniref:Amidohydrolase family protein n=1 Tax=Paenibacillus sabuli TaxID=2772509 RepID=A0A927BW32_9BACL|nr:amidohydrolase family protein [Paenibacillus sabuli]MBD2846966.1 amidohydrolase family protein [Paenibacillus sabuli]